MRLIDADKIKVTEYKDLMGMSHKVVSWEDIRNAPTIDVFDKIRTEIEEHVQINQNLNTDRARALCWCLDVIDKYIEERNE